MLLQVLNCSLCPIAIILTLICFQSSFSQLTLVTTTYPPFTDCSKYQSSNSTSVFGAEVNLIRSAFTFANWTEGQDYVFECVSGSVALRNRLRSPGSSDLGIFGGIAISHARLQKGFKFSQPTVTASLPLVHRKLNKPWFFVRSFTMITWGVVFMTVVAVGVALYYLEDKKSDCINTIYNVALHFFNAPDFPMDRFPSKLVQFFSLLLVAIIVYVFTAASTNIFYNDKGAGVINSLTDLADERVLTNKVLGDYVSQYSPNTISIEPKDVSDPVASYIFDYMIIDGPFSDYLVRQYCELAELIHQIDVINYGFVFTTAVGNNIQTDFNRGILNAKDQKSFEIYEEEYYSSRTDMPLCTGRRSNMSEKIGLYDSRSLFYIYLVGLGLAVIVLIISLFTTKVKKTLQLFELRGIRGKGDKKVQRRMATVAAMHAAVSLQAIEFLKRISQETITSYIAGAKINMPRISLDSAYRRIKSKSEEKGIGDTISMQIKTRQARQSDPLRKTVLKLQQQRFSLKHMTEIGIKPFNKTPEMQLKKSETRRSSFLHQSMQSYQLARTFTSKFNVLSDQSPKSDNNSSEVVKKFQTNEMIPNSEVLTLEGLKKAKTLKKDVPLWKKLFGKKGIKIDKNIVVSAANLLKTKESALMIELTRKKTEISNRASFLGSSAVKVQRRLHTHSPKSTASRGISPPKFFRTKFFETKQQSKLKEEDISQMDSYEFFPLSSHRNGENFDNNERVSLEVSARSQALLLPSYRRHQTEHKSRLQLSAVGQPFGREKYDYEARLEDVRNLEPTSKELWIYDFSKMIQAKKDKLRKEVHTEKDRKFNRPKTMI